MTPKQKAIELFDKFNKPDTRLYPYVHNAQQCALIAVDEIIEALENNAANSASWLYYEEVKKEIEKL